MFVYSDNALNHQFYTNDPGLIFRLILRNDYFYVSGIFPSGQESEFKGAELYKTDLMELFLFAPSIHPISGVIHKNFLPQSL